VLSNTSVEDAAASLLRGPRKTPTEVRIVGVVYKLAIVLTKSQIRGAQRNRFVTRLFGDPRIILVVDILLVLALGAVGYLLLSTNTLSGFREIIRNFETQGLAEIPIAIGFLVIVLGVLYEISQPIQSMSTDLVNWLPISPTEYVAASVISESYLYSFIVSLALGVILGPALYFGLGGIWIIAALMTAVALLIGSCVVEILDALTNRISSGFYKRSGRSAIILRLILTLIILVFVQLIFSGQIAGYLFQSLVQTVRTAWYVPVVWPSITVLSLAQGSLVDTLVFGSLSVGFTIILFAVAVVFRARFWIPVPVSIRLTTKTYQPSGRLIRIPGLSSAESALIRKDFRSILRRREMARFLAIPFVLAVSLVISLLSTGASASDSFGLVGAFLLYVIPVTVFAQMLAMTSIGSEGYAVWNVYVAPIRPRDLLLAKFLYAISLGIAFSIAIALVFGFLVNQVMLHLWIVMVLGIAIVFEQAAIGMSIGARFPDFRETIRSRYVGVWASVLGGFGGLIVAMLTISPVFLSIILYHQSLNEFAGLSLALGVLVFISAWKIAEKQVESLLGNIRI
jgi:hypothetical protein